MEIQYAALHNMQSDDVDLVRDIESEAFQDAWPLRIFEAELENGFAQYRVVKGETTNKGLEEMLGYSGVWFMVDQLHLVTIAVRPIYQKLGIGERLLFDVLEQARSSALQKIILEVRQSNLPAQALYRKFGFVKIGELPHYYQDDDETAVVMRLNIQDDEGSIVQLQASHKARYPSLWTHEIEKD